MKGRLTPVWDAAHSVGVTRDRVTELACQVRGVTVEDVKVELGFAPDATYPFLPAAIVATLTRRQVDDLAGLLRFEPFNQQTVDEYRAEADAARHRQEHDRRSSARFMLDDPHLRAQREGWGL